MADLKVADAPANYKSKVWQYFGFESIVDLNGVRTLDKTKTVCKECRALIVYGTGNTTNMSTHLQRRHPNLHQEMTANKLKPSPVSKSAKGVAPSSGQRTLKDLLLTKLNANSPKALDCTKSIGIFIAKDLRPYSVVDNPGFRYMVNTLEPRYKIPNRTHFADKVVPQLYEEVKLGVISQLNCAPTIALTTDGWTSRATQSYETITAHFINDEWDMTNYVLQTRVLGEVHTGHNLAVGLKKAMSFWNLSRNGINPTLTTDNASNVCNAVKEAGASAHIRCFEHTLNLSTRKGLDLPQMDRLLGRVNRIVSFFHRSDTANTQLKAKQKLLELTQHKLLQDCKTRWNSSYDMLERYVEQQAAVQAVFLSKDIKKNAKDIVTVSEDDVADIESVLQILEPIKMVTTVLCEEEHPTVSMLHPLKERLLSFLEVRESDTTLVKSVKLAISSDLRERYTDRESLEFMLEASALDPRFKSLPYITDDQRHEVVVKAEPAATLEEAPLGDPQLPNLPQLDSTVSEIKKEEASEDEPPKPKKLKSALDNLFGDVFITKVEPAVSLLDRIQIEMNNYLQEPVLPLAASPLLWWKSNCHKYPLIAKAARVILCVPATSVPSERVFSTAGDIVSAQRASLSQENVDALIFLKKNMYVQLRNETESDE